jgi:histone acetyltransferase (RNA polymerase elongator complex component)
MDNHQALVRGSQIRPAWLTRSPPHASQVVPWTIIKRWFEEGKFVPYSSEQMFDLLMQVKARVHPWIRLNRVVRDIPIQVQPQLLSMFPS